MGVYITELMRPPKIRNLNALYQATQWLNDNVPDTAIVGSYNSGIVGYFSDATVINLDGLMNNEEVVAIYEGNATYWDYAQRYQLTHVMDYIDPAWSPDMEEFRNFPMNALEQLYEDDFIGWSFIPKVYYIFQINSADTE